MEKAALGETVGNFPGSDEELLTYNVIILGNVSGALLGELGQEMLADYVAAGGGLLLLAGARTYGQANFTNQRFLDLLPASFHADGDYGRLKERLHPSSPKWRWSLHFRLARTPRSRLSIFENPPDTHCWLAFSDDCRRSPLNNEDIFGEGFLLGFRGHSARCKVQRAFARMEPTGVERAFGGPHYN